ncbi:hypothetical protein JCM18382A_32490 [Bradyrhizobium sp. 17-4]|jgi:hypothetical protein
MTSPARTRFQSLPNKRPKLLQVDGFGQVFVENAARFSEQSRRCAALLEDFNDFRSPEQFGQGERIDGGVLRKGLRSLEADAATRSRRHDLDTPPLRDQRLRLLQMALADNERRPVQDEPISGDLGGKPFQRV